ncbi:MAG: hypothetical protein ACMUEL_04930 [Flavobacteriales bacterium Tduv]
MSIIVEGLKTLIIKLEYNPREIYADKGYQIQPTCLTFIVEASKTAYKRKPIRTFP